MNQQRTKRPPNTLWRRSEAGFTLIELMVSLAIFSVVSLAAFSVLSSTQKAAVINDQTVAIQRNVRLAIDLISRDLRMVGYGNPAAGALAACPNHLNPTNGSSGAVTPATSSLWSDSISVMTIDQPIGTLASAFTTGNVITVSSLASDAAVGNLVTLEGIFTASVTAVNTPNNTWSDPTFKSSSAVAAEDVSIALTPGIRRRVLSRIVSLRDAYTS